MFCLDFYHFLIKCLVETWSQRIKDIKVNILDSSSVQNGIFVLNAYATTAEPGMKALKMLHLMRSPGCTLLDRLRTCLLRFGVRGSYPTLLLWYATFPLLIKLLITLVGKFEMDMVLATGLGYYLRISISESLSGEKLHKATPTSF